MSRTTSVSLTATRVTSERLTEGHGFRLSYSKNHYYRLIIPRSGYDLIVTRTTSQAAQEGATLHRALSDPSRLRILEVLEEAEAPLDARELGARVGLHFNTVRSHLRVLAEAGLVPSARERGPRPGRPRLPP